MSRRTLAQPFTKTKSLMTFQQALRSIFCIQYSTQSVTSALHSGASSTTCCCVMTASRNVVDESSFRVPSSSFGDAAAEVAASSASAVDIMVDLCSSLS